MRRPIAVFATHDDLLTGVCRQIEDHGSKRWKVPPGSHIDAPQNRAEAEAPEDPDVHFSADTQARGSGNGAKRMPGDKMTSRRLCPPGRGLNEESFIDKAHTGTCEPGRGPRVRYHGQGGYGRQGLCQQDQPGCPAWSPP
ncbi:MAG: hypothetical protein GDA36_03910 [Rhodobacteraceae bacterium]|nr:hypothetical protein [Paracoccaceae bacterium]